METQSVVIRPPVMRLRISPLGFHRYASEFRRAAELFETDGTFSPVPYYLCCHSIELFLKAFLLGKSIPVKQLRDRKLGHHLPSILTKAKEPGMYQLVAITTEQESEIHTANDYYSSKGFEYFQVGRILRGYSDLPDILILAELSSSLEVELKSFCLNAA